MRLRIVSLLSLVCASALLVTGCNQSIVSTTSGTPGGSGASYVFATNFNPTTQEGTVQSFPITQLGTNTTAVTPASIVAYPGAVTAVACSPCGSGYTTAPVITIAVPSTAPANGGSQATAVATLNSSGAIATITVTFGGSGYVTAPLVTVPPPPAGAALPGLTATVTTAFIPVTTDTSGGLIVPTFLNASTVTTNLEMDSVADGRVYYAAYPSSVPNVVTLHEATVPNPTVVVASNGSLTSISLTATGDNVGAGYSTPPAVVIAAPVAPNGIQATAVATLSSSTGPISGTTITANGAGYTSAPTVTFAPPTTVGGVTAVGTANCSASCGTVTSITLSNAGSGYVTAPAVTFSGGGFTTTAAATAAVAAPYGALTGITITNPGSGYNTTTPAVTIAPPPSAATATAVINGSGVVTAINVNNGGIGYTAAPTVTLSAPNSGTATATATFSVAGALTGLAVTNPGFGYSAAPTVTIAPQAIPAAGAAANVTLGTTPSTSGSVASVVMTALGGAYLTAPTVTFSAPDIQAAATASFLAGAVTGASITNVGAGYLTAPTVTFSAPTVGTTATGTAAITNGTVTGITITSAGTGYTAAPTITIGAPPTGNTTATGTTTISVPDGGIVTAVNVTNAGTGYVSAPTVSFSGVTPAPVAATATATISSSGQVTAFTILTAGSGYTSSPVVTLSGPAGTSTATAGTAVLNGSGTITSIPVATGGSGYLTAPTVTIAGNGSVQAVATAAAVGPVSIGALNIARTVTDVMPSNFKSMTPDRAGNVYVSEANGHMIVIPVTAFPTGSTPNLIVFTGASAPNPSNTVTDYDMSLDAGGTGASAINPTGIGASNTGFSIMTTDSIDNLYTYVAGSGVITEYGYNPSFNFPPYTNAANYCAIGTSLCYIGNPAVTSPAIFPTGNRTITLPSSVTNVVDIVTDQFNNIYVLAQNGSAGAASVTEYAPCSATCSPAAIKTITGANTGFNIPGSLAVDTIGNIYVEDFATGNLNKFLIFTSNESGNVAPSLSFTETVPNVAPGGGVPTGYGLAVY